MSTSPVQRVALVTGFERFAGLAANPASRVACALDGETVGGLRVVGREIPVSLARTPAVVADLVAAHRPAVVLALGLAAGAAVPRVEMHAINAAHFSVPDNDGYAAPPGTLLGEGPAGRSATWDGAAVVAAIEAAGVPARLSFHAGTHLCNATLYHLLGLAAAAAPATPCGFLHLPYLPEQVIDLAGRPGQAGVDLPSMALDLQIAAARAALHAMAGAVTSAG